MKTHVYKEEIEKHCNMMYMVEDDTHYYCCHDGRCLEYVRTEVSHQDGYTCTMAVYGCEDCHECENKTKCLYKDEVRDVDKNKVLKIKELW